MARRAAYALPTDVPETTRQILLAGCDAIDRCALAGEWLEAEKPAIKRAKDQQSIRAASAAALVFYYAADATHAADASLDFSAAETACINSTQNAITHAFQSPGLSPLQVRILAAADLDLLRFACREAGVERYHALGPHVMGRMTPVYPPDRPTVMKATETDPTHGAQ